MRQFNGYNEFRKDMDDEEYILFGLSLQLKKYKPYQALCRIGEVPNEIYYVVDGKIAVTNLGSLYYNKDMLEGNVFHYEGNGSTLGESSILFFSNRTASLVAVQPSLVLTVNKDVYMSTIGYYIRRIHISRMEMIQRIPIFEEWTLAQISSIYKHMKKVELRYSSAIYSQGEVNECIYIVLDGEIDMFVEESAKGKVKRSYKLRKIGKHNYIGNEEGFMQKSKDYTCKIGTEKSIIIEISKSKILQNTIFDKNLHDKIIEISELKKKHFQTLKNEIIQFNKERIFYNITPSRSVAKSNSKPIERFLTQESDSSRIEDSSLLKMPLHYPNELGLKFQKITRKPDLKQKDQHSESTQGGTTNESLQSSPFYSEMKKMMAKRTISKEDLDELMKNNITESIVSEKERKWLIKRRYRDRNLHKSDRNFVSNIFQSDQSHLIESSLQLPTSPKSQLVTVRSIFEDGTPSKATHSNKRVQGIRLLQDFRLSRLNNNTHSFKKPFPSVSFLLKHFKPSAASKPT